MQSLRENQRRNILDAGTRRRRLNKYLESLEADNAHADPHGNSSVIKKTPDVDVDTNGPTKEKKSAEYYQKKYGGRSFQQLLLADQKEAKENNRASYGDMCAPKSKFPPLHLCDVCGYESKYNCVTCGARICQKTCFDIHYQTRCVK